MGGPACLGAPLLQRLRPYRVVVVRLALSSAAELALILSMLSRCHGNRQTSSMSVFHGNTAIRRRTTTTIRHTAAELVGSYHLSVADVKVKK